MAQFINTGVGQKTPQEALKHIIDSIDTNHISDPQVFLSMLRGLIRNDCPEALPAAEHVLNALPNARRQLKNVAGDYVRKKRAIGVV